MLENWIKPQIPEEEELDERCMQHALSCLFFRCRLRSMDCLYLCCLRAGVLQERAVCSVR